MKSELIFSFEYKLIFVLSFKEFDENSTRLCYVFVVESGPIWSIKFHPNESALEKRLGILAVATSNQSVLIYSLPYLNDKNSTVLSISPNFECNLKEGDVFFNQKYLEQVTRLSWFITNDKETLLAAGYVSGLVSVWHVSEDENKSCLYPRQVIQAHNQSITALDFKATESSAYHLLTAGFDRNVKVFTFEGVYYQEMTNHYALSRANWAEWWLHWPGFIMGLDDCFALGSLVHRQPLEFAARNNSLLSVNSTIVHFNINHWLNSVILVLDSGDVLGCHPGQLLQALPKDKWSYFKFSIFSSTDFNKVVLDGKEEIGIVFSDFKVCS